MWDEPYLETCCRSALHRLRLCGATGRPAGLMDGPCLNRLAAQGLCAQVAGNRFVITQDGVIRHDTEIQDTRLTDTATTAGR